MKLVKWIGCLVLLAMGGSLVGAADEREGVAFFEKNVRPVLVEKCYACHHAPGPVSSYKAGFLLDSLEGLLKGGDSGKPAVVPGDVEKSNLIQAIRYGYAGDEAKKNMPPKRDYAKGGKLPEEVIKNMEEWVKMGAPVSEDFKKGKAE